MSSKNSNPQSDQQLLIAQTKEQAMALMNENQVQSALPLLRQCAHWGDLDSQLMVMRYYLGNGKELPFNPNAAIEYARLAALNGNPEAMRVFGELNLNGQGTARNEEAALYFLDKAAKEGDALALDDLAMMALRGQGMEKDLKKAKELIDQALALDPDSESFLKHARLIELSALKDKG